MSRIPSREEALFADALAQPPAHRLAYLEHACAGNATLRAKVASLLAAHEGPDSLLEPPAVSPVATTTEERPGVWIGRYKLLQKIGEGGCGVVWMAEQEEPVHRRVALKVIKLGMDTKAVIARFEAERQALAMMDHPNIAKVLDGGATNTGRPFFVMELVRGIPITRFCDDNNLPTKERLNLFIQVCHAIQHAHQKGIIHRDIKPSNMLVTLHDDIAVPYVIDFGIAKATQGRLTDSTLFTAFEQFIGTPVYMSPEQAEYNALDVDTRSDIYSLGVLLYELLTGRPPFDPKTLLDGGIDQIRRIIRETEPPRPSTCVRTLDDAERTTAAKRRNIAPAQLSTLLRGDLDWIVMKALEKNRVRRYQTANAIAMDVQRHLAHEPVVARPPSTAYRFQKLFLRHKVGFAAGTVVAVSLVGGLILSTALFFQEKQAHARALTAETATRQSEHAAATARLQAENLLSFVFTDLGEQLDDVGQSPILQQVSERAVAYYEGLPATLQTRETRASHAFAVGTVGNVLGNRGESSSGREQIARAMEILEELEATGPLTPFMRVAYGVIARAQAVADRRERQNLEAVAKCEHGEKVVLPVLDDSEWGGWAQRTLTDLLHTKAYNLTRARRYRDAVPEFRRAIASAEAADGRTPLPRRPGLRTAQVMAEASEALFNAGQREEARDMARQARARLREFVEREPQLVSARYALALAARNVALQARNNWQFDEMLAAIEEQQTHLAQLLKFDSKRLAYRNTLAGSYWHLRFQYDWWRGDLASAEAAARTAVELLAVDWAAPWMQNNRITARLRWVWALAALGRSEEANRELAATTDLYNRFKGEFALRNFETGIHAPGHQTANFHLLNWPAMRKHAEDQLRTLKRLEVDPADKAFVAREQRWARRDLMRAAFEMGDYAEARHQLAALNESNGQPSPNADIDQRFNNLGSHLTRIHVLARAGENEAAQAALLSVWPEVEEVFAAGPDHLFNQVQTARALAIKAEVAPLEATAKRELLKRAAGYLRPAATAGRLTQYEREVTLAGIEKQLAVLADGPSK